MKRLGTIAAIAASAALAAAAFFTNTQTAEACGCFAPPDPSVPIVQAGERIVFEIEDGVVTSHIQIQFQGAAEEFGWLLPLPSLGEMELGTEELFNQIIPPTQPRYIIDYEYVGDCPFDPNRNNGGFGGQSDSDGGASPPGDPGENNPLVRREAVGPFDAAWLRADNKDAMFQWLSDNGFFVPAGTDTVVDPYIHEGGYFLALKLLKGEETGDIQPVVVKYASDLPMIPIVLTSVAANPDMGIQVWVLGDDRAIPRNYQHTEINDTQIDWFNFGANYADVVTDAVDESNGHHSFVTEYAGTTDVMQNALNYEGRFGSVEDLRGIQDAITYMNYLNSNGFPTFSQNGFGAPQYSNTNLAVLAAHLPIPAALEASGVTPNDYYTSFNYFVTTHRDNNPELYTDLDLDFVSADLTADLEERVIRPAVEAQKLFEDNPYMTRMFTTLSPEEMTKDPVFSFNPDLPEVERDRRARGIYYCGIIAEDTTQKTPFKLIPPSGIEMVYPNGIGANPYQDLLMPSSQYQINLREEGQGETDLDNTGLIIAAINSRTDSGGCSVAGSSAGGAGFALLGVALLLGLRRRRD